MTTRKTVRKTGRKPALTESQKIQIATYFRDHKDEPTQKIIEKFQELFEVSESTIEKARREYKSVETASSVFAGIDGGSRDSDKVGFTLVPFMPAQFHRAQVTPFLLTGLSDGVASINCTGTLEFKDNPDDKFSEKLYDWVTHIEDMKSEVQKFADATRGTGRGDMIEKTIEWFI